METIILNKSPNSGEVYTTEIFNLKHPIPCLEKNTTWVPYKSRFRIVYPNILLGMWADSLPRFPRRSFTTGWRLRWNNLTNQPPFPTTCFAGRRSYDWGRRPQSAKVVDEDTTGEKGQRPCHGGGIVRCVDTLKVRSRRRHSRGHMLTMDWLGAEIIVNWEWL
jgi:hypothetical protein